MAKHFEVSITDTTLTIMRKGASIDQEAALDGIYVLRTTLSDDQLDGPGVLSAYNDLSHVERDFRHIHKVDDIRSVLCQWPAPVGVLLIVYRVFIR